MLKRNINKQRKNAAFLSDFLFSLFFLIGTTPSLGIIDFSVHIFIRVQDGRMASRLYIVITINIHAFFYKNQ